jgi:predicted DNA-binding transcriptional regulator YafY
MARRAERLFEIIQALRREPPPLTAARLGKLLEVTSRTVYRDIAHLQARGVPIEGAAGFGYVLRPGFDLPPLMFTDDELEALLIGARIVQSWADPELARAAQDLLAKVEAVLPEALRPRVRSLTLAAPPNDRLPEPVVDVAALRRAARTQQKVRIDYLDLQERPTSRTIWPMSLAFFPPVWLAVAWCELREDFRSFRVDRIGRMEPLDERYPQVAGRRLVDYLRRQDEGR